MPTTSCPWGENSSLRASARSVKLTTRATRRQAFAECLPVVFQAVTRSSLSGPERLLFAIDADLADDYDVLDDSTEALFDAPDQPQDWSVVADTLAQRLKTAAARESGGSGRLLTRLRARPGHELDRHGAGECRPRRGAADPLRIRGPGHGELRTTRQVPAGAEALRGRRALGAGGDRRDLCQAPGDRDESGREPLRTGPETEAVGRGRRARRIPVLLRPSRPRRRSTNW